MSYSSADAIKVLRDWVEKVNVRDIEGVLAFYSDDGVLLPTFSGEIRTSRDKIRDYFEGLSGFEDVYVTLHEKELVCQRLIDSAFALSGTYRWNWVKDGTSEELEARFTYIIDVAEEAPIRHHHSSLVPVAP